MVHIFLTAMLIECEFPKFIKSKFITDFFLGQVIKNSELIWYYKCLKQTGEAASPILANFTQSTYIDLLLLFQWLVR